MHFVKFVMSPLQPLMTEDKWSDAGGITFQNRFTGKAARTDIHFFTLHSKIQLVNHELQKSRSRYIIFFGWKFSGITNSDKISLVLEMVPICWNWIWRFNQEFPHLFAQALVIQTEWSLHTICFWLFYFYMKSSNYLKKASTGVLFTLLAKHILLIRLRILLFCFLLDYWSCLNLPI